MHRPSLDLTEPSRNDEIEVTVGSGDDGKYYTPPPHIAARLFYHPINQSRRKDSAASSRRNSVSSAHSRSSHGCNRSVGPQSKYIAQHLRRASILEDRKARLADRAAHAEKVRLRAALAKSCTRDISVSEERALAAAQARERNLAEIAASCAEEVKRAKAVAENMKEKREQEIRKMKLQMEERLAEAEKRREELRSRNAARVRGRERGHSLTARKTALVEVLPQVKEVKERDSSPMRPDVAVSKIQWWWRAARRKQAVADFSALGLSIDGVRDTSFDEVTELLSQEKVLVITARVLRICGLREGEPGSVDEAAAVRSFLSAFLILGHPAQVLSNKEGKGEQEQVGSTLLKPIARNDLANPQSQDLVAKARDLLISFENILSRLTSFNNFTPPPTLFESFPEVYATFYNAFIAWKARDSDALVELMIMQFVELDGIWESVKNITDGSVDEVYKESIQSNQILLLVRIKKLAGPIKGMQMVRDAVRKARKARTKKPTGDVKPRVAENSVSDTLMGDLGAEAQQEEAAQAEAPTHPGASDSELKPLKISVIQNAKSLLPINRVIVHELAINGEYRTNPDEYRKEQEHLLAPLFQEMRATMEADNQEAHFLMLLQVAHIIRVKLQRLVTPGNSMHAYIGALLDTESAKRQFTLGNFSYEKFFEAMGSLLPKLCAPVRDDEVKQLREEKLSQGNYVDRLEALIGFIDVMLSDYANYLLQIAAPRILEQATSYEAKAFAAELADNEDFGLETATAAWRTARQKVAAEMARRDPEPINQTRPAPPANRIYNQMLVDVCTQIAPLRLGDLPETLELDHERALETGRLTRRIITTGAILLQCKNLLKRDVRAPWRSEAQRILLVLEKSEAQDSEMTFDMAVDGIMAALEAGRSMPAATKRHLRALVTKLVSASAQLANAQHGEYLNKEPEEPVLRLLLSRLRGYILARLSAASASEKVKATSTAGEKLAGLGLAEFVDKVRDMVDMMGKPAHYGLFIRDLDFKSWSYKGTVNIEGAITKPTADITLNVLELKLLSSKITVTQNKSDQSWDSVKVAEDAKRQRATITFPEQLPVSPKATLTIEFTGELNHDMAGFYRSQYKPAAPPAASVPHDDQFHYMLSTQFEACDARRAFPCFDEPNLKATFDFSIEIPDDQVALSNMPALETQPAGEGKKVVKFERSPVMSTYLLAWAVGDFEYVEAFTDRTYNGKKLPVRVYTTRGLKEQGRWALEHAPKIIDYFSEQFEIDYPLPKSDILAVHEFTHGAMENWGLVTYRMTAILFDEKLSEARFRNRIAYVVAHELAHQWFGNLVTMDWWDELWLNEGFATWAGWFATDYLHPEWDVWPQFVVEGMDVAFGLDSVRASHPIQVVVRDALEVNQIFDKISYLKGCSMIRMLAAQLGVKTFLKGIAIYLKKNAYGNAKTKALWDALSEASGKDVNGLMGNWIEKIGFPVLTVTEGKGEITVKQSRFLSTGDVKPEDDTTTWWVPLGLKGKVDAKETEALALTTKEAKIDGISDEFYQLNAGATGFYRVNYPPSRLQTLGTQLDKLGAEDKIFITGSAADLAFAGYGSTAALLGFVQGMKNETHYHVLNQVLGSLGTVKCIFGDDEQIRKGLEKFTLELTENARSQVGWEAKPGEDYNTSLLRKTLLMTAVNNDGANAVPALKKEWFETPAIDGKEICLLALGHVQDENIVQNDLLPFLFNISPPAPATESIPSGDVHILSAALAANRVGRPLLWKHIKENWQQLNAKLGGNMILVDRFIERSLSKFADIETLNEIEAFFKTVSTKGFDRTLETVKDKIRGRAGYKLRDVEGVRGWLVQNGYA
ncbi:peptidase family M1-domain-containing protein [Diplogelasinospora grovesii]|uniref:Peptidase family M1-domain-containing protein n=1 Tax=Diplogelasinospora grovesii TaxID=303347 RepID=A0AAN6N326_9PEZI|nr:peptidase family M1-domain-containing protein [Diplogelasinospora grovesii]